MTLPGIARPPDPGAVDALLGRRIEEWIVSTLDDRGPSTAGADWLESLDRFAPMKRPAGPRVGLTSPASTVVAASTGGWARFRLSERRGITLVALSDQALIRDQDLEELAGDLAALVEAGHRRLVLDFGAVERLSSRAAATIAGVVRRCSKADGGAVKVSGLRPPVASAFEVVGLGGEVEVCPDAASAFGGPWPDRPALGPLPVSVLAALTWAADARPARDQEPPAMTDARLVIQEGPATGQAVAIRGPRFVIGRGPGCQLRVGSSMVSRSHASIERRGGRLVLRDLGSTNGTLLNGRLLRDAEAEVGDGDRVRIGPLAFALAVGPAARTGRAEAAHLAPIARPDELAEMSEETLDLGAGIKAEVIEDVLVVTPLGPDLAGEPGVDVLRDALTTLHGHRSPRRVVVDLAHVGQISGRAIGVLVAHHLRLDRDGGALRLCQASPRVALVLDQVRLGMLVQCHPSVDDAVISAWPAPEGGLAPPLSPAGSSGKLHEI